MREALDRTLLLMRTDLAPDVQDEELLSALRSTVMVISADAPASASHSGQSAIVAAALNMARSGHEVWLDLEDAPLVGQQPPLAGASLLTSLIEAGEDLLPEWRFHVGRPDQEVDLLVVFGEGSTDLRAGQAISLNASDWTAELAPLDGGRPWAAGDWPIGALAAGAMAAGEAFKAAMRKLAPRARSAAAFSLVYAPCASAVVDLAPEATPLVGDLGDFDLISGGAIANAALFTLLRLPCVRGTSRVFDDDESAMSNLNRNALLRRSRLDRNKVDDLASFADGLTIEPVVLRYGKTEQDELPLSADVLMGVDDIPSRWKVQRRIDGWLGIGATDGFSVQISYHRRGLPCAGCVHPEDTPIEGPIPTVAFVSFWSGLLVAVAFLGHRAGVPAAGQQIFFTPLRPESWGFCASAAAARKDCPVCSGRGVS